MCLAFSIGTYFFVTELKNKKRNTAIHKKKQALQKDEVWKYSAEEDTIDYVLFRICESTGNCIKIKN